MDFLHKLIRKILEAACVVLFCALVACVTWQVFSRFVIARPSGFTEELAKIIFVWLALTASAYLFGETDGHMNIGLISDKAKGRKKIILSLLSQTAILLFAAFVLVFGGRKAVINGLRQINPAIPQITTGHIYMALFICGICTSFFCAHFILKDIKKLFAEDPEMGGTE